MNQMVTDTAHRYWNAEWQKADGTSPWAMPEPWAIDHARTLVPGCRILDLGTGIGRHALAFAEAGYQVTALDASEAAVSATAAAAFAKGLSVETVQAPMTDLPFQAASFDHVLAWNVIYHGDESVVRRTFAEVARVLRPGGSFMATMLSARRLPVEQDKAKGREISRNTWVFEGPGDKIHPHYFCSAQDLLSLMWGFEIFTLFDRPHEKPGSWHWHLLAERLA
jgi:2-polyprenyl-3-methyl-5-hydroxy-6-metoxy-1,4-benzoquinol methylase